MDFKHHPAFIRDLKKFIKKHCQGKNSIEAALKHLQHQLSGYFEKKHSISPEMIGMAPGFGEFPIYFFRLIIANSNLKPKQCPKSYFYMKDNVISILCFGTHLENYKDAELRQIALERLHEILEEFGSETKPPLQEQSLHEQSD